VLRGLILGIENRLDISASKKAILEKPPKKWLLAFSDFGDERFRDLAVAPCRNGRCPASGDLVWRNLLGAGGFPRKSIFA